jgi:hypothetical protein
MLNMGAPGNWSSAPATRWSLTASTGPTGPALVEGNEEPGRVNRGNHGDGRVSLLGRPRPGRDAGGRA